MEKNRAIPHGYMTVGKAAKKMGVTVRTLQYYDKKGLLAPSAESEGGRRLYTDRDLIILHQILSLKSLGFSLSDIKDRLIYLSTPAEVAHALAEQANDIRSKIEHLSTCLTEIERLRIEVLQMKTVDFKKYADIIANLRMNNEYYYLIKKFDDDTLDHIRSRFDQETGIAFMERFNQLSEKILQFQKENIPPETEECQKLVKHYWDLIVEFTNGDMSMLPKLMKIGDIENATNEWEEKQAAIKEYLGQALEIYFSKVGINPFEEVQDE